MTLNDKAIRSALKLKLLMAKNKPKAILDELGVENGRAIADLVAIYKFSHCYEIKSDLDTLNRLERQLDFYNRNFQKITLVVTEKYSQKCLSVIPEFWGVIVAKRDGSDVIFKQLRKAKFNKLVDGVALLKGLWRSELSEIYEDRFNKEPKAIASRGTLIKDLSDSKTGFILKHYIELMETRIERKSFNTKLI